MRRSLGWPGLWQCADWQQAGLSSAHTAAGISRHPPRGTAPAHMVHICWHACRVTPPLPPSPPPKLTSPRRPQSSHTPAHPPRRLSMRAVQRGKVAEVDGNQMFNRPGPRLLDCLEWLVGLLRDRRDLMPQDFPWRWWHELQEAPAAEDKQEAAAAAAADVAAVQEPAGAQA